MLTALLAAALCPVGSPPKYTATLVLKMPAGGLGSRTWISGLVVTEDDTVAGFTCDSVGVHGESTFAKPFAWTNGRLFQLPLGASEYGHVYSGNDKVLVGDVLINYTSYPAKWIPDPKEGWAKASLTVLSKDSGWAKACSSDGSIWAQHGDVVRRYQTGKVTSYATANFYLEGVDTKGRLYGNRYRGRGPGNRPENTSAAFFETDKWTEFGGEGSWLNHVNAKGEAVGTVDNQAVRWAGGKATSLCTVKGEYSTAQDINSLGEVVGYFANNGMHHPFLWRNGVLTDLSAAVKGLKLDEAMAINDAGSILVRSDVEDEAHLYLLKPGGR